MPRESRVIRIRGGWCVYFSRFKQRRVQTRTLPDTRTIECRLEDVGGRLYLVFQVQFANANDIGVFISIGRGGRETFFSPARPSCRLDINTNSWAWHIYVFINIRWQRRAGIEQVRSNPVAEEIVFEDSPAGVDIGSEFAELFEEAVAEHKKDSGWDRQPLIAAAPQVKPPVIQPAVVTVPAASLATAAPTAIPVFPPTTQDPVAAEKPKLPTVTPASTGFSFGTGSSSIFGKKPEVSTTVVIPPASTTAKTPVKNTDDDENENEEEYEPEGDFKPVIPLPDLVEVKTGEEEEQVVFNNRAKLYIFATETSEWKERGTGELKVLHNKEAKKYRVVMRRDQVLKVCANFPIVGSMVIKKMANNEKAYTWFCEDFSEDEPAHVKLSARFANVDIATKFKELFEKAAAEHKKNSGGKTIDSEIKPAAKIEMKKEVKEDITVSPSNKENGFGELFKPKPGSWECKGCYISNKTEDEKCVACQTNKDGTAGEKNIFSKPSILQPAPGTPKIAFGFGTSAPAKEPVASASSFGAFLNGSPSTGTGIIFGGGTPKTSIFGGAGSTNAAAPSFSFNTKPGASSTTPSFNFKSASPATSVPQGNALFGGSKTESTPAASFSFAKVAESTGTPKFSFGKAATLPSGTSSNTTPAVAADTEEKKETPKSVFGTFANKGESFASLAAKSGSSSVFSAENAQKAQQELASLKKTSTPPQSAKDDEGAEAEDGDYEPEVDFKPVCPLPNLVEVKTGEEDEEVVITARCKLYKFYAEISENMERGVGDLKILKNKENKYRVVMRREQVHKLCANFIIEKSMKLTPNPNLPQVLTFMRQDYSDDAANADPAIFTAKFKDETVANNFKKAVVDAQATM